jgi:hypothetical protein
MTENQGYHVPGGAEVQPQPVGRVVAPVKPVPIAWRVGPSTAVKTANLAALPKTYRHEGHGQHRISA